jgi:hypothetical protein
VFELILGKYDELYLSIKENFIHIANSLRPIILQLDIDF